MTFSCYIWEGGAASDEVVAALLDRARTTGVAKSKEFHLAE